MDILAKLGIPSRRDMKQQRDLLERVLQEVRLLRGEMVSQRSLSNEPDQFKAVGKPSSSPPRPRRGH